jgi:thermitase
MNHFYNNIYNAKNLFKNSLFSIFTLYFLTLLGCKNTDSDRSLEAQNQLADSPIGIAVSIDMGPGRTAVMAFQYLEESIPKILKGNWQVSPFGSFRRGFLISKSPVTEIEISDALSKIKAGLDAEFFKGAELAYRNRLASFDAFSQSTTEFPEYTGLTTQDPEWHLKFMDVFKAWDKLKSDKNKLPGEGILIGHVDTGLLEHPEIFDGKNFVPAILWDKSKNFVEKNVPLAVDAYVTSGDKPVPSHGTATTSVIVSPRGKDSPEGDPNFYVTGVAPAAKILPIRATSSAVLMGLEQVADVANAVGEVRKQGAKVISLSLAGRPDPFLYAAIKNAVNDGVIVIAAGGANSKIQPWPASFSETILATAGTIACTPWEDATFSKSVDITVPGVDIWHATTYRRKTGELLYASRRGIGTSFSAPILAGAASIWLSYHGWDHLAKRYGKANIYKVFRKVLESPTGHRNCKALDPNLHGVGYLNVLKLIQSPLPSKI